MPDTAPSTRLTAFLSFPPRLRREPPREESEPRVALSPASAALTVKPSLTSSSPR